MLTHKLLMMHALHSTYSLVNTQKGTVYSWKSTHTHRLCIIIEDKSMRLPIMQTPIFKWSHTHRTEQTQKKIILITEQKTYCFNNKEECYYTNKCMHVDIHLHRNTDTNISLFIAHIHLHTLMLADFFRDAFRHRLAHTHKHTTL